MIRAVLAILSAALLWGFAQSWAQPQRSGQAGLEEAVFAGGCFWCTEADFEKIPGVVEAISGYTGGRVANPTYEQVVRETTGHREAVLVRYDPARVRYSDLVERFWRTIDPTDAGGQFCDRGESYTSAIFVTPAQRPIAEASKAKLAASGTLPGPVVTPVLDRATFWPAEAHHQNYARRNGLRYRLYRAGCGRDSRLAQLWR